MKQKIKLIFLSFLCVFTLSGFFSLIIGENIFVVGKNTLFRLLGNYTETIPNVTIKEAGYDETTKGTWKLTKNAKWIQEGKVEVIYTLNSHIKKENKTKDIVLVLDTSNNISTEKLTKVKESTKEFIDQVLEEGSNQISLITFQETGTILSSFSQDASSLKNQIDSITTGNASSYTSGLVKVKEVLNGYTKEENKDLVVLFLVGGKPNQDIANEKANYQILKEKYPYITIQGIEYEMGNNLTGNLSQIVDHSFIAKEDTLKEILLKASMNPNVYEKFALTETLDEYFTVESIVSEYGTTNTTNNQIEWNLDNFYHTGSKVTMKMILSLKTEHVGIEGYYPVSEETVITSQLQGEEEKTKTSGETIVLGSHYEVVYDSNVPTGCTKQDLPSEKHMVYEKVEKKDTQITCPGYTFKGWVLEDNIETINDETFMMPNHNVVIRGTWTKLSIIKSTEGSIRIGPQSFATDDWSVIIRAVEEGKNIILGLCPHNSFVLGGFCPSLFC